MCRKHNDHDKYQSDREGKQQVAFCWPECLEVSWSVFELIRHLEMFVLDLK